MLRVPFRRRAGASAVDLGPAPSIEEPSPLDQVRPVCHAPFVSMRFSPTGEVNACGPNWAHSLGNVRDSTLREIWDGDRLASLRAAVSAADFSSGCQECGIEYEAGNRLLSHAHDYDRFELPRSGGWPKRLEFGLSNTCNLQCVQCNGELSSAIRAQREKRAPLRSPYGDDFFEQLRDFLPHLELATFIGGEPFLARECRRVWDLMIEMGVRPETNVTTNGTIWNDRVERYMRTLEMNVSVSLDGVTPETMDQLRVGSHLEDVRAVRDQMLAMVRSYGGGMTLNHCVMPQNWHEFGPFLLEADELGVPVHAIRVVYPASSSLFHLPVAELATVVRAWQDVNADMQARLTVNRGVWDGTVGAFVDHLASRDRATEMPVALRDRTNGDQPDSAIQALSEELQAWSSRPSMHVRVLDGRVQAVDAPDWARRLETQSWAGLEIDRLLGTVERALGAAWGPMAVREESGKQWWSFTRDQAGPAVELRIGVLIWNSGPVRHLELLFNASDDLDAADDLDAELQR